MDSSNEMIQSKEIVSLTELISTQAAAKLLGRGVHTIHHHARRGRLPAIKIKFGPNGMRLFRREDVLALREDLRR
jgi:excisionase family DNA binding protein